MLHAWLIHCLQSDSQTSVKQVPSIWQANTNWQELHRQHQVLVKNSMDSWCTVNQEVFKINNSSSGSIHFMGLGPYLQSPTRDF